MAEIRLQAVPPELLVLFNVPGRLHRGGVLQERRTGEAETGIRLNQGSNGGVVTDKLFVFSLSAAVPSGKRPS